MGGSKGLMVRVADWTSLNCRGRGGEGPFGK